MVERLADGGSGMRVPELGRTVVSVGLGGLTIVADGHEVHPGFMFERGPDAPAGLGVL
jgi:hypothetical protein